MLKPVPTKASVRRMMRRITAPLFGSPVYGLTLTRPTPKALRLTPPCLWQGNAERGASIIRGRFDLGIGKTVVSVDPWATEDGGPAFRRALHGFGWLRDMDATENRDAARDRVRTIVGDWLARNARWSQPAWQADVLGLRIASWLTHYDDLFATAGESFRRTILRSLSRQLVHLERVCEIETEGANSFAALKGLIYGAVCLPDGERRLQSGLDRLSRQIDRQIFPDGGQIERCPSRHHEVLRNLVEIRALLDATHLDTPDSLQNAIDRMAPMLRFYRHGDGGLALFNGSREESSEDMDATLARADARGRPPRSAPHTGFARVSAGRLLLIADAGTPPPPGMDLGAHAGTLSFELSIARERLIVNCGTALGDSPGWSQAERSTAAHSTISIADTNSSEIRREIGFGRRPRDVACERIEDDTGIRVVASHDGYAPTFGAIHHRSLTLLSAEEGLDGEDRIEGGDNLQFTGRFHLHPDVSASVAQSGRIALLRLRRGGGWRLTIEGAELRVEESIYLGSGSTSRRNQQLVFEGMTGSGETRVKWALRPES